MAEDTWPTGLPQAPLIEGFSQQRKDSVIRSPMGYGPAKIRRRTTTAISVFPAYFQLSGTDRDVLTAFYETTLSDGTVRFNWLDPVTRAIVEMRFTAPIQIAASGNDIWLCVCQFEIMP